MSWFDQAVFYHMYPLGLCGAPKLNNGGDGIDRFEELENWVYHMRDIGCNAVYIGPLFESVGHGYETTDYKLVDKRLGDNDSFKKFVLKCHNEGIKVVVDGVFNHTGREFFAFKDLKQNREKSKYKDWYCNVNFGGNNEYNDGFSYEAWRGYNILVKLNQKNPEVKDYIYDVMKYWVKEFDIDGIRLDCADVLDLDFMKGMRAVANEVKEDFWLMGEVIHGDYSRWANQETLHSVTNYELHKGLYSGHNDHNYFEIAHTIKRLLGICGQTKLYTFVDNHDVERIASKLNNKAHMIPVHILLYTVFGIPSIYYGSEFALEGTKINGSDDALRPAIKLNDYRECKDFEYNDDIEIRLSKYKSCDKDLLGLIMKLADAKKKYEELSYGEFKELSLTNRQYSFARVMGDKAVVVMVNNDDNEAYINVGLPVAASKAVDILTGKEFSVDNGRLNLPVKANNGYVLALEK